MCAFLVPHRSTNTAVLSLQFQGRWGRLWFAPHSLRAPRSVQERPAALADLLRYSDIKDELFHFLSVKPFMHPHTFHWSSSQDERWWVQDTSCSVRGHTGSHLLERKVSGKQAGASQSTSSWWSYKVLIIKTCQCVVWWYQSWTMMVQHSAGTVRTWSSRSSTSWYGSPAACHTFTLSGSPCITCFQHCMQLQRGFCSAHVVMVLITEILCILTDTLIGSCSCIVPVRALKPVL